VDYYAAISPRIRSGVDLPAGSVAYDSMILSETEMDKDEFYADCMTPIGLRYFISGHVMSTDSHMAVFAAQRTKSQGHVGPDEIALMQQLTPHLRQAADVKFRLAAAREHLQHDPAGLDLLAEGCVTVARSGKVQRANARAQAMFAAADGVAVNGDRIALADKGAARCYAKCLADIGSGKLSKTAMRVRDFPARRPSGKRPFLISVRPLPATTHFWPDLDYGAALVFIRDTEDFIRLDRRLLAEAFQLSDAEADIAAALDNGQSINEIARDREVSITTVRSQLYALMAKLGVRRQNDLIRLLAQYRMPFA
jgi:DNA-binding CsgD family transcriptional regulator